VGYHTFAKIFVYGILKFLTDGYGYNFNVASPTSPQYVLADETRALQYTPAQATSRLGEERLTMSPPLGRFSYDQIGGGTEDRRFSYAKMP